MRVKPASKAAPKASKAPPAASKAPKGEKPKAVETPAWPNKAECNEAEAKFHSQLAQVVCYVASLLISRYL